MLHKMRTAIRSSSATRESTSRSGQGPGDASGSYPHGGEENSFDTQAANLLFPPSLLGEVGTTSRPQLGMVVDASDASWIGGLLPGMITTDNS